MTEATVLLQRDDAIATVTLNRPDRLNALDAATWALVAETMAQLSADESLRCIVIRGAGGNFAAGADIQSFERERADTRQALAYATHMKGALAAVAAGTHPTVALIQGVCVGGGLELASVCDIRVCGEGSRFGVPIKKLGLTMSYAELIPFVDLVGPAAAKEILLEGEVFGAGRAKDFGLVNRVVPDHELLDTALSWARRLAGQAPLAMAAIKDASGKGDIDEGIEAEKAAFGTIFASNDAREGIGAFLGKRTPNWTGT